MTVTDDDAEAGRLYTTARAMAAAERRTVRLVTDFHADGRVVPQIWVRPGGSPARRSSRPCTSSTTDR